jgi:uncharacterized protein YhfF
MRMDPHTTAVEAFWQAYLDEVSMHDRSSTYFEAFQFGAGREMANQLAQLVLDGVKTATSDLIWHLEFQGKPLWRVGDEHIVLDGSWAPVCVIRTTALARRRFIDIDADFARAYGEGDLSLEWWREHVYAWYARQCREMDREATPEMPLLCERFQVIYVAPSRRHSA